jgi:hypothetical protein
LEEDLKLCFSIRYSEDLPFGSSFFHDFLLVLHFGVAIGVGKFNTRLACRGVIDNEG